MRAALNGSGRNYACVSSRSRVAVARLHPNSHHERPMIEQRKRLLNMLAGCPDGATQHTLMVVHGFPPGLIYEYVQRGLIRARTQTVMRDNRPTTIFRFHLTEVADAT